MRRLQKCRNSAICEHAVRSDVESAARKAAEMLDAPVREVCIQIMGPMRSIAAQLLCLNDYDFRLEPGSRQQRIEARSEEHTSELQSLMRISYAVFCLKKKTTETTMTTAPDNRTHFSYISKRKHIH